MFKFYLYSITTRIETTFFFISIIVWFCSISIPLQQGLRRGYTLTNFLFSYRSISIPLQQGLRRKIIPYHKNFKFVLSLFHYNKDWDTFFFNSSHYNIVLSLFHYNKDWDTSRSSLAFMVNLFYLYSITTRIETPKVQPHNNTI